jgi:hypothetical protein
MARTQKAAPVDLRQQLLDAVYAGQAFHRVLRDLSLTSNQVWGLTIVAVGSSVAASAPLVSYPIAGGQALSCSD